MDVRRFSQTRGDTFLFTLSAVSCMQIKGRFAVPWYVFCRHGTYDANCRSLHASKDENTTKEDIIVRRAFAVLSAIFTASSLRCLLFPHHPTAPPAVLPPSKHLRSSASRDRTPYLWSPSLHAKKVARVIHSPSMLADVGNRWFIDGGPFLMCPGSAL